MLKDKVDKAPFILPGSPWYVPRIGSGGWVWAASPRGAGVHSGTCGIAGGQ